MVNLFGQIVWIFGLSRLSFGEDLFFFFFLENTFIWTGKTVQISVKTFFFFFLFFVFGEHLHLDWKNRSNFSEDLFFFFFFFFLENTLIWAEKTVSILTEKRNASSHFLGKSLLPPQIILSSYGHALEPGPL